MTVIRPISDLRNKSNEISRVCHETGEPVFITKNGESDLVVMSMAAYERRRAMFELHGKLDEAEAARDAGDKGISHREMMAELKSRLG